MTLATSTWATLDLARARRVLLVAGSGADGEVLGCLEALRRGLRALGREVAVSCATPIPQALRALLPGLEAPDPEPPSGPFSVWPGLGEAPPDACPMVPRADLAGAIRVEFPATPEGTTLAERTLDMLEALGVLLDREMAVALYVALTCATDSFQNHRVTPSVHACAARLLHFGVPTDLVGRRLFREDSMEFLETLGLVLRRLEIVQDGRVACSVLRHSDGPARTLTEPGLRLLAERVDLVRGGEVTALLQELDGDAVRVHLRSRRLAPEALTACVVGDGRSLEASGLVAGPLEAARARVLRELAEGLNPPGCCR